MNGDDMKVKMNAERHAKTYCNVQKVIAINGQGVILKNFPRTDINANTYLMDKPKTFNLVIGFSMLTLDLTWTIKHKCNRSY